ncbi:uncharacterized protein LOC119733075 [Patiria miniata]|uniref:CCHC-type domain-containing protein n=1 Tax=Patiria miniata TaxID=46514 RepID=A0A914AF37_PATMI|nr:uncharacterized protein LOC119733075 [Patiria miniata]
MVTISLKPHPLCLLHLLECQIHLTQFSPPQTSDVPRNDVASAITALADVLTHREEKLPKKEPEIFKGSVFDFPVWMNSFSVLVEQRYTSPIDRLYYLGRYTSGEARECIKGLLALNSENAYQKAKKLLTERYGNKMLAASTYREKISKWPTVKQDDGKGLRNLSDFLFQCETAMSTLSQLKVLDDPAEHKKIIEKLPRQVQGRWLRFVDQCMYGQKDAEEGDYPPFAELCKFIAKEARIACSPFHQKPMDEKRETKFVKPTKSGTATTFASKADELTTKKKTSPLKGNTPPPSPNANKASTCPLCKSQHQLDSCSSFAAMSLSERHDLIKKSGLCFGCLKWGHRIRECRHKKQCAVCGRSHPTLLHDFSKSTPDVQTKDDTDDKEVVVVQSTTHRVQTLDVGENCSHALIVPVVVHHIKEPSAKVIVYALLDEHSDSCFVSDWTLERLGIDGEAVQLSLSTILAKGTISSRKVHGLTVKGLSEDTEIQLPGAYSRESINANREQIPKLDTVKEWPHLKRVANLLPPYLSETEIGLLIGCNATRAIKPRDIVHGEEDAPYAVRTALGWGVIGMMRHDNGGNNVCRISNASKEQQGHFAFRTQVKEVSPLQVTKMFEMDFIGKDTEEMVSHNDRKFMQKMKDGIHRRDDGHFEMPLPLKTDVQLPNNKPVALKRLNKQKMKMLSNQKYRDDYKTFMENIIEKGYAEKVPDEELDLDNKAVWYIPHHGVYHPKKPNKIRVVFDCSAEYEGEVLNRHLLQGPDMTNNLVGVLCRFRKDHVAFTCDIEGMFHQVGVNVEDRNYLRFLWWPGGDMNQSPNEYRMTVHLFGATSSPACANFALKCAADAYEDSCGTAAADFIRKDFYVDDGLKSVPTSDEALKLIEDSRRLCQKSGFHLHKFISNDKVVVNSIPLSERAKDV